MTNRIFPQKNLFFYQIPAFESFQSLSMFNDGRRQTATKDQTLQHALFTRELHSLKGLEQL